MARRSMWPIVLGFCLIFLSLALFTVSTFYLPPWIDASVKNLSYIFDVFVFFAGIAAMFAAQ